jgi:hypothetical protein
MIPLFIPFANRPDLLGKAIASASGVEGVQVVVINNSADNHVKVPMGACMTPRKGMTFSQTQNLMMRAADAMRAPFYFFMHSDAQAGDGTISRLFEMARMETRNWGVIFTNYDALAVFNTKAFERIDGWDEGFPWYASDQDCYRRLQLAGYELLESNLPVYHEPSQTLKADPQIRREVDSGFHDRCQRYVEKWGGPAGSEIFDTPFNR